MLKGQFKFFLFFFLYIGEHITPVHEFMHISSATLRCTRSTFHTHERYCFACSCRGLSWCAFIVKCLHSSSQMGLQFNKWRSPFKLKLILGQSCPCLVIASGTDNTAPSFKWICESIYFRHNGLWIGEELIIWFLRLCQFISTWLNGQWRCPHACDCEYAP